MINEEVKKKTEVGVTQRTRRAASVDSSIVEPRTTRSRLTKTSIIKEVIPEESAPVSLPKKTRKKRNNSATTETLAEEDLQNESKSGPSRPKRGRKVSETKDFKFSLPQDTDNDTTPATAGEFLLILFFI